MSHFILMLTNNDVTVGNAMAAYESMRASPLRYVGFKDVGLPVAELKRLAERIRADGREVMLEVVATSEAGGAAWSRRSTCPSLRRAASTAPRASTP